MIRHDLDDGAEKALGTVEASPAVATRVGDLLVGSTVGSTGEDVPEALRAAVVT